LYPAPATAMSTLLRKPFHENYLPPLHRPSTQGPCRTQTRAFQVETLFQFHNEARTRWHCAFSAGCDVMEAWNTPLLGLQTVSLFRGLCQSVPLGLPSQGPVPQLQSEVLGLFQPCICKRRVSTPRLTPRHAFATPDRKPSPAYPSTSTCSTEDIMSRSPYTLNHHSPASLQALQALRVKEAGPQARQSRKNWTALLRCCLSLRWYWSSLSCSSFEWTPK